MEKIISYLIFILFFTTTIPGMLLGYWWSFLTGGFILGLIVAKLIYDYVP